MMKLTSATSSELAHASSVVSVTSLEPTTRIYRLTPVNPRDPNWRGSVHRDAAVVRAGSEDVARSLAAEAFNSTIIPSAPGRVLPYALWQRPDAVRAEIERGRSGFYGRLLDDEVTAAFDR